MLWPRLPLSWLLIGIAAVATLLGAFLSGGDDWVAWVVLLAAAVTAPFMLLTERSYARLTARLRAELRPPPVHLREPPELDGSWPPRA
jgi:hypothetical protein